jgi:hypothetical protein
MRLTSPRHETAARLRAAGEDGFTMLFALLALFVGGLLTAAAFTAANGDINLTHTATLQTKAYYAALSGVQRYQYQLSSNPNYWIECNKIGLVGGKPESPVKVPGTTDEEYTIKTLASAGHTSCEKEKQLTILETTGAAKGTFRILSTGTAGTGATKVTRSIVATFAHPGFTKYVYESNYEVEDPANFSPAPTECEHYYAYRVAHNLTGTCPPIEFAPEDKVNGPMHTNDAAEVCAANGNAPTFGRNSEDPIEMNGGHYAASGCANEPNIVGKYTESAGSLLPPGTDAELLEGAGDKFSGRTVLVLKAGTPNTLTVNGGPAKDFPANGVIYVENSSGGCTIAKYSPFDSNTESDTGCGNVYVSGTYTESLTIASADDVIVNGNLTTTSEASGEPTGGATLGLIAENFVRVYHPVKRGYELNHYVPTNPLQEPINSKCVTLSERTGTINKTTEVKEVSSTAGLAAGDEVSGTGIAAGTTISSVKSATIIVLSKPATKSETTKMTFDVPTGYEYYAGIKKCVEQAKAGYTYHETEDLFIEGGCESTTTYTSKGFCEYENTASKCSSKATNLNSTEDPNKWGVLTDPVIDAAILSTKHSWIVDNYKCGAPLGKLTVWGSIAQFWRGPVGTAGNPGTGYIKNYNYDERLAAQQPPSFLSPTSTSWKLSRETAPPAGFSG